MPTSRRPAAEQHQLFCNHCKKEFVAYKDALTPQCPRCGRTTRVPLERHWLRLVAVAIILAVLVIIVLALVLQS
jgi:uncharacterized paraquat-inducible protein A